MKKMASASKHTLPVKEVELKDAANRAAMKLGYPMGMKEQLKIVAFLSGSAVFAVLPTGLWKSLCYAC